MSDRKKLKALVDECSYKLRMDPACLKTRALRGHACMKVEMWDVAAGDFTEILHVRKDDIHGTFSRGMAFFKAGKTQKAIADFSRVLELNPDHFMARYSRAGCYNTVEMFNKAIEDYQLALKDDRKTSRGGTKLYLHETAEKVINETIGRSPMKSPTHRSRAQSPMMRTYSPRAAPPPKAPQRNMGQPPVVTLDLRGMKKTIRSPSIT